MHMIRTSNGIACYFFHYFPLSLQNEYCNLQFHQQRKTALISQTSLQTCHTFLSLNYFTKCNVKTWYLIVFICIAPISSDFENYLIYSLALYFHYDFPEFMTCVFFSWMFIFWCCLQFICGGCLVMILDYFSDSWTN